MNLDRRSLLGLIGAGAATPAVAQTAHAGQVAFLHGVASGDPDQHSAVFWTRVTPADPFDFGAGRIDLKRAADPGLTLDAFRHGKPAGHRMLYPKPGTFMLSGSSRTGGSPRCTMKTRSGLSGKMPSAEPQLQPSWSDRLSDIGFGQPTTGSYAPKISCPPFSPGTAANPAPGLAASTVSGAAEHAIMKTLITPTPIIRSGTLTLRI